MSPPNWSSPLDVLVNLISGGAFLGFLVFVIIYAALSDWRATAPGRALMYAVASLDLVVLLNTVHLFTGPYAGQVFVRIPVYTLLLLSSWRLVVALIQILRSGDYSAQAFYPPKQKEKP